MSLRHRASARRADDDWQPLPNMSLLRIERHTLATSMETLMPSGSQLVS